MSGKRKEYEGFGMSWTAAQWARILELPANTVWRRLRAGETPEEIATRRSGPGRKPAPLQRYGKRKAATYDIMVELLDRSGYDPEDLTVETARGGYKYKITRLGEIIGAYDYQTDRIWLRSGDRLALREPIIPDATIERLANGVWAPTLATKKALLAAWQAAHTE